MTVDHMESEYAGDEHWRCYSQLYAEDYLDDEARELADMLGGHLDMAVIIRGKRGFKEGVWWISQRVPALEGLRPIDCLSEPHLLLRLREVLMRMP